MDNQYAEQVLKEFVERDRMLRENSVKSDYDKFCETTCRAIEIILAENEELKSKYDRALSDLVKAEKEKNELKEMIKKEKLAFDYKDKIEELETKLKKYELETIPQLQGEISALKQVHEYDVQMIDTVKRKSSTTI